MSRRGTLLRSRHPINVYLGRVTDIHDCDMDGRSSLHEDIWTDSLHLHPDRVEVRTFDHRRGVWLEGRSA